MILKLLFLILMLLSLIGLGRAMSMMRYQNKMKLISLGIKSTLNTLSVAVVAFYGDMALHGQDPMNSLRVLFVIANPIVLTILFKPRGRDRWLMPVSISGALAGTSALAYELLSRAGYVPEWSALDGWFPDATQNVGHISTVYVVFVGSVLAVLLRHKISWRWPSLPYVNRSTALRAPAAHGAMGRPPVGQFLSADRRHRHPELCDRQHRLARLWHQPRGLFSERTRTPPARSLES
jgi:hypothetical protein